MRFGDISKHSKVEVLEILKLNEGEGSLTQKIRFWEILKLSKKEVLEIQKLNRTSKYK